jgi:hypothetical protein
VPAGNRVADGLAVAAVKLSKTGMYAKTGYSGGRLRGKADPTATASWETPGSGPIQGGMVVSSFLCQNNFSLVAGCELEIDTGSRTDVEAVEVQPQFFFWGQRIEISELVLGN